MDKLRKYKFHLKQNDFVDKVEELEPKVRLCLRGYDYYQGPKETKIIKEKFATLKMARETYEQSSKQLENLMTAIKQAQQLSETADRQIMELGLEPLAPMDEQVKQFCSKYFNDINDVEANKENIYKH